jgi:hypothetical protein
MRLPPQGISVAWEARLRSPRHASTCPGRPGAARAMRLFPRPRSRQGGGGPDWASREVCGDPSPATGSGTAVPWLICVSVQQDPIGERRGEISCSRDETVTELGAA